MVILRIGGPKANGPVPSAAGGTATRSPSTAVPGTSRYLVPAEATVHGEWQHLAVTNGPANLRAEPVVVDRGSELAEDPIRRLRRAQPIGIQLVERRRVGAVGLEGRQRRPPKFGVGVGDT